MIRTEHKEKEWKFPFVEYRSEKSTGKPPMILQLHGAGERGNGDDELYKVDVYGFSKLLKSNDYDCLFIMPQCPGNSFWSARVESVLDFVEQIKEKYDVDESRIYLTGLSMGGYGTWYTAMARPDLFAAIAPICGGGMAWNAHVLKMPAWVFHGAADETVSVNQSDEMVNAMRANGTDVKYTRMDGVGHDVWDYAYTDEMVKWLLSHQI